MSQHGCGWVGLAMGDARLTAPFAATRLAGLEEEVDMPRKAGDRYVCEKCGATLVYEKACPCPEGMPHSEICCGEQMKKVSESR
jgi:hypothetical protein